MSDAEAGSKQTSKKAGEKFNGKDFEPFEGCDWFTIGVHNGLYSLRRAMIIENCEGGSKTVVYKYRRKLYRVDASEFFSDWFMEPKTAMEAFRKAKKINPAQFFHRFTSWRRWNRSVSETYPTYHENRLSMAVLKSLLSRPLCGCCNGGSTQLPKKKE